MRIWKKVYNLLSLHEHMFVIGSGKTDNKIGKGGYFVDYRQFFAMIVIKR